MENDLICRSALLDEIYGSNRPEVYDGQDIANWQMECINSAPAVDAEPVRHEGCEFCKRFDFSEARCEVTKKYAHISFACGSTRFPKSEQFKFCPNCGAKMDGDKYATD